MESAPNLPKMDCEVFSLHAHDEYDMILISDLYHWKTYIPVK